MTDSSDDRGDADFDPRADPRRALDEAEERVFGRVQDPPPDDDTAADPVDPTDTDSGTGVDEEASD